MKTKRFLSFVLATLMLFSLVACGSTPAASQNAPAEKQNEAQTPAETAAQPVSVSASELSDIDAQLKLIHENMDKLQQPAGELPWFYTVTDLDHDGSLEFIAASQHPTDRSTNLKLWEVSADRKALTECSVQKDEEESFPDIMTDSVDTFHVTADDTWNYLFYDNIVLSDTDVYTSKSAFHMPLSTQWLKTAPARPPTRMLTATTSRPKSTTLPACAPLRARREETPALSG